MQDNISYNRFNFHNHTFCVFKEVDSSSLKGISKGYTSKSGSRYYFTAEGVYRVSNHWGRAANCRWRLQTTNEHVNQIQRIGYAKWTDFYPNNENQNLFYIEVDWDTKDVTFQHKNNPSYDSIAVLRTASATAKVIQQIKEVLLEDNWAKYLKFEDLNELRKIIVDKLITTNNSLVVIKREFI